MRRPGDAAAGRILLTEPLGYLDFLHLLARARLLPTDSGGLQDESTVLGVPCLTLRDNTERPVTLSIGSSVLVGNDRRRILAQAHAALAAAHPPSARARRCGMATPPSASFGCLPRCEGRDGVVWRGDADRLDFPGPDPHSAASGAPPLHGPDALRVARRMPCTSRCS